MHTSKNRLILSLVLIVALPTQIYGLGLDLGDQSDDYSFMKDDDDRAIIVTTGVNLGNVLGVNLTSLLPLLTLASTAFTPIIGGLALAALILASIVAKDKAYYDPSHLSSYSEYSRALGLDLFDWEKLSLVDWFSMGEEVMRKFDPFDLECQKRLICDLHQNTNHFGSIAQRMVDMFSYLKYAQVLSLPEILKSAIGEYVDAADRGRSLTKDCGQIYNHCDFSVKSTFDRYSTNLL